jgi:ligand-binding sensor domain-containing protein
LEKRGIFEIRNSTLIKVPGSESIASRVITGMMEAPGNKILVVTQRDGIYQYNGYSQFDHWDIPINDFVNDNFVTCAVSIPKGYLLGSSHNGLLMIDKGGNPLLHLNKQKGLQNNGIEYIYPDNNGNLWLALRDGIDYVEINSPFTLFNSKGGISGSGFTSLYDKNTLYLGTSEGLYYKENASQAGANQPFRLIPGSQGQTYNLQKIRDMILLTHNNGAYLVHSNRVERLGDQTGAWLFVTLPDHPDYLICGSYMGLYLYHIENNKPVLKHKIKGFDNSARVIEVENDGTIWIAHGYLGVYKVKLSDDLQSIAELQFYNSKHGFPSNVFINVFKINNELVFAGERGIFSYNQVKNIFEPHPVFNSLISPQQHTRKLIEDREGNVWFSVGDNLGVLKKRSGQNYEVSKTIFNKLQRTLVGGFEHIAYYDEQNVIIGTEDGFVHFDPSFNFNRDHTFSTLVRKVEITADQDSVIFSGAQPSSGPAPVLGYHLNAVRFTYSASSYEDAPQVQYQFKLEGHDEGWSSWSTLTSKEYTNLREGDYAFVVKSRDIYNREGVQATFAFSVLPPWYRTVWSYILYALLVFFILYLVYRFTKSQQQKTMRLKEVQHHEEVLKAEKEIIKLNNEKLENEIAHKNKELASSAMHVVRNVETIQKIKASLLDAIEAVSDNEGKAQLRKVLRFIANEITLENNWEQFELHFNQIHQNFLIRLRKEFPELTHNDIKLISYLKLNLSSKEIAPLLNLSVRGVEASRYRIRKKMHLSPNVNLTEFILKY